MYYRHQGQEEVSAQLQNHDPPGQNYDPYTVPVYANMYINKYAIIKCIINVCVLLVVMPLPRVLILRSY